MLQKDLVLWYTTPNRFTWYIWKKIYPHKRIAKTVDGLCLNRSILYDLEEYIKQSAVNALFIQIFVHGDSFFFFFFFIPKASQQIMNFNHINFLVTMTMTKCDDDSDNNSNSDSVNDNDKEWQWHSGLLI